ncbi:hypothetical protein GH714_005811 [Hevea brasiliensis]|uniref:eIF3a PCI domain-containing protein n=1 Tax=Hevea brasiliensis TaxID=3981 RepID=A0A6A6KIY3_HEVBR|nr:hypothetical protein GH714_005811 [Hevea brasiliensis]
MTAHRAFQFCKQYKRTTEFRRLCEIIRNHLANLNKYRDQRDRPDLSTPESLQLYLDTRFEQLKVATELELWQPEGFTVDSLICCLAALAVAPYDRTHGASHLELENEKERNLRMADLIGFNLELKLESREVLSRSFLLSELVSKGVLSCVTQEVKIYHLLEHEFLPLDLAAKVLPLLSKISKLGGKLTSASSVPEVQLSQYIPALEKLATLRLLQQGLESDGLRDHLTIFAESLNKARAMIYPPAKNSSKLGEILPGLAEIVDKEHKRLLARKSIIEKRKEEQERQLLEMEREEESRRLQQQKKREEAEQKRLAAEIEQRKNQRILQEIGSENLKKHRLCLRMLTSEQEVELSRQHHDGDLREKIRLSRMLDNKMIFQERVVSRRQTEFARQRAVREERITNHSSPKTREGGQEEENILCESLGLPLQQLQLLLLLLLLLHRPLENMCQGSGEKEKAQTRLLDSDRWSGGSSRQASDPERWSGGSTRQPPADAERWGSGAPSLLQTLIDGAVAALGSLVQILIAGALAQGLRIATRLVIGGVAAAQSPLGHHLGHWHADRRSF